MALREWLGFMQSLLPPGLNDSGLGYCRFILVTPPAASSANAMGVQFGLRANSEPNPRKRPAQLRWWIVLSQFGRYLGSYILSLESDMAKISNGGDVADDRHSRPQQSPACMVMRVHLRRSNVEVAPWGRRGGQEPCVVFHPLISHSYALVFAVCGLGSLLVVDNTVWNFPSWIYDPQIMILQSLPHFFLTTPICACSQRGSSAVRAYVDIFHSGKSACDSKERHSSANANTNVIWRRKME